MIVELKNESIGVKHFLEVINELSNIDNSKLNILDKEIDNFANSLRDKYLTTKKREKEEILDNIRGAIREVKAIESGKIDKSSLKTLDDLLAEYK